MTLPDELREELERMERRFGADDEPDAILFEVEPGRFEDIHGEPVDLETADPLMVIALPEVMSREQAEREGREILGEVDDYPDHVDDPDLVKVAREDGDD